jgi:translocation and assembly module TamB
MGLAMLLGGGLALYVLRSEALRERIRGRIVAELEKATGARAELKKFDFDWTSWTVAVEGLALHGSERPEQRPYVLIPKAELKLTVRSWFGRDVDLSRLIIEKPEVHIYVAPDGTTNIPSPAKPSGGDPIASLLRLRIRELQLRDGIFEYDGRATSVRVEARDLDARLDWEQGPQYRTRLTVGALTLPVLREARLDTELVLRAGELRFERLRLDRGQSWVQARGNLTGFRQPVIGLAFQAQAQPGDIPDSPVREGTVRAQGQFRLGGGPAWEVEGNVQAEGLAYRDRDVQVRGVSIRSAFRLGESELSLPQAEVRAIGSALRAKAVLKNWKDFTIRGEVDGLELDRVWGVTSNKPLPWSGILSGPLTASGRIGGKGVEGMRVEAELDVRPEADQLPVTGRIAAAWDQRGNRVELDTSYLVSNQTRVSFRGALGDRLEAALVSSSLSDLEPVVRLLTKDKEFDLPLDLAQGQARATVEIDGPMDAPVIRGTASLRNLVFRGVTIDRVDGSFSLAEDGLTLEKIAANRGQTTLRGEGRIPLDEWKLSESGRVSARLQLVNADAAELQQLAGVEPAVQMKFGGEAELGGTLLEPDATVQISGTGLQFAGESFGKAKARFALQGSGDARLNGELQLDSGTGVVDAIFRHPRGDWRNGTGTLKLSGGGWELSSLESVKALRPGLGGPLRLDGSMNFRLREGRPRVDRLGANARVEALTLENQPLGSLRVEANTVGEAIGLTNTLVVDGRRITGSSLVQLDGDYNAEGVFRVPRMPFALIRRLAVAPEEGKTLEPLPVQGFVEGEVVWKAPLSDPRRGSAQVTLARLQVRPRAEQLAETDIDAGELVVRNNGPILLTLDAKALEVKAARLQALNTDLRLSGQYLLGSKAPWNFVLNGKADLAILSNFQPGIVASGDAEIEGGLRGAASDPLFSGKMRIRKASFFLRDFPNGIEDAEGVISLERNRANIEKLTGKTGGGQFEVTGFLGLNQGESTYRLQAKATNVRVRYPEGVSTVLDADLALTGSSTRSLLAGNVMVQRTGFNPRSDFASVVGSAGAPIPAQVGQNEFLRNLLFDIRIRTSPNATIQSSYTQDLTAEADLRLRGSPAKPILLGSVEASQGDVNFFGNRYTVSRGEILFYNVATIQPTVDLNLETRIRGVTVFISVNGPLSKLNVSYRSEPPLLSADIFALLTVGRAPLTSGTTLPSASDPNRTPVPGGTGNSLLGIALSSAVSSRVEKFFGKSRIKIDPQMTGVENVPQARLTIEQSISRDVTLTLVTNLSRAQQQVVRLEWDLSREWQFILVRDENGVFGADFAYRKRFK